MGVHVTQMAAAVAGLTISGVTVLGLDAIPEWANVRALPLLCPSPNDPEFVTDLVSERLTLAGNQQVTYTLNYKLFQAPVGANRGLFTQYPDLVANTAAVMDALLSDVHLGGAAHVALAGLPIFRPVLDPAGEEYHGAVVSLRVTEFWHD